MRRMAAAWRRLFALALLALAASACASTYPLSVVDLAGRTVVLPRAPQRIFLQNGNDLMALALLDREDPFARLAGWNNQLGASDPSVWRVVQRRWPGAAGVPLLNFDDTGHVDLEALVRLRPDLVLLNVTARESVEGGPVGAILARLHIPVLYIDSSRDPVGNVTKTVALLGRALDRETQAAEYLDFYRQRLAALQAQIAQEPYRPRVFIEARAGQRGLDYCCQTQGRTSWGLLIEAVGGRNIGSQLLSGETGQVPIETLIRIKPDVLVMTGTPRLRRGGQSVPLGYGVSMAEVQAGLAAVMGRPALRFAAKTPEACVHAFNHQFYNSVFNIVALEYLARALYPERFAGLAPDDTYRQMVARFTTLPDSPFVFSASRSFVPGGACAPGKPE